MLIRRHRERLKEFDHAREGVPDYQGGTQPGVSADGPEGAPSEEWTVAQLKDYADTRGVDLAGASKKADILDALNA